jgi:hypothetical protein
MTAVTREIVQPTVTAHVSSQVANRQILPYQVYYDHRGWDSGGAKFVQWTNTGSPNLAPASTSPAATGTVQGAHVIAVRTG